MRNLNPVSLLYNKQYDIRYLDLDDTLIIHGVGMTYDDIQPSIALHQSLSQFICKMQHSKEDLSIYNLFEKIYSRDTTDLMKPAPEQGESR